MAPLADVMIEVSSPSYRKNKAGLGHGMRTLFFPLTIALLLIPTFASAQSSDVTNNVTDVTNALNQSLEVKFYDHPHLLSPNATAEFDFAAVFRGRGKLDSCLDCNLTCQVPV